MNFRSDTKDRSHIISNSTMIVFSVILIFMLTSISPIATSMGRRSTSRVQDDTDQFSVEITKPKNGSYCNSNEILLRWKVAYNSSGKDPNSTTVTSKIFIDGDVWGSAQSNYTSLNISEEGKHSITVEAHDKMNNSDKDIIHIVIDTVSPAVNITKSTITDHSSHSKDVTLSWNGTFNGSGLDHYEVKQVTDDKVLNYFSVGKNTSYTLPLENGSNVFYVKGVDKADNTGVDSKTLDIYLESVSVEIKTPDSGRYYKGRNLTVEWEGDSDNCRIDHYSIRYDGTPYKNVGKNTSYELKGLNSGPHTVTVKVVSNYSFSSSSTIKFYMDSVDPSVDILHPSYGEKINSRNVTLNWTGEDPSPSNSTIKRFDVRLDGQNWTTVRNSTEKTFKNVSFGEHTLAVKGIDIANNTCVDNVSITTFKTRPKLNITSPENSSFIDRDDIEIKWNFTGNFNVDHYVIRINNGTPINAGESERYKMNNLTDGKYRVTVGTVDNTTWNVSDNIYFTVDTEKPTVNITKPAKQRIFYRDEISYAWNGTDNIAVDHYSVKKDNASYKNVGKNTSYTYTNLTDGKHTLFVKSFDKANNSFTDSITVTINKGSSPVNILKPTDGSYLNSTSFNLRWSVDGNLSLDHYEVKVDDEDYDNVGTNTSCKVTNLSQGEHKFFVRMIEVSNNSFRESVSSSVDTKPPVINITSPKDDSFFNKSSILFKWDSHDKGKYGSGLDNYFLKKDVADWIQVNGSKKKLTNISSGTHTVFVKGVDKAGNEDIEALTFTVDDQGPVVDIISPKENKVLSEDKVECNWSSSDNISEVDHYSIQLDDNGYFEIENTSYTFNGLEEGDHTFSVKSFDSAGNMNIDDVNFTVFTEVPEVNITNPNEGAILDHGNVTVRWNSSVSERFVDNYEIRMNYGDYEDIGLNRSKTYRNLTSDYYPVDVKVVDIHGRTNVEHLGFSTDLVAPTIEITSPTDITYMAEQRVDLKWKGDGTGSGIKKYTVRYDNQTIDVGTNTSYTLNNITDGEYNITVSIEDEAGNKDKDHTKIIVDTNEPALEITNPTDRYVGQNVTVEFTTTDEYGIDHNELSLDGSSYADLGRSTSYHLRNMIDGKHTVKVKSFDVAGNTNITTTEFWVDTSAASVKILQPDENSMINSSDLTVKWSSDDDVDHYNVKLDSNPWNNVGKAEQYTFKNLDEGYHEVFVKMYDQAGHSCINYVPFTIDTNGPKVTITSPKNGSVFEKDTIETHWKGHDNITKIDRYEFKLDDKKYKDVGNSTERLLEDISPGHHEIKVKAIDKAGNNNTDSVKFHIDKEKPVVEIIHPISGGYELDNSVKVKFNVTDDVTGLDRAVIHVNGSDIPIGKDTSYTLYNRFEEGENNLSVTVYDGYGHKDSSSVSFYVDLTTPQMSIDKIFEENRSKRIITIEQDINLKLSSEDPMFGIEDIRFGIVKKGGFFAWNESYKWEDYEQNTKVTLPGTGSYDVYLQGKAVSGKLSNTCNFTVTYYTEKPKGEIRIDNGAEYTGNKSITINIDLKPHVDNISYMKVGVDDSDLSLKDWIEYQPVYNTSFSSNDDHHRVWLQVRTGCGLVSNVFNDSIIYYKSPPEANLSLSSSKSFNGSIPMEISAHNENSKVDFEEMKFEINNNSTGWVNFDEHYTYNYSIKKSGYYEMKLFVKDSVGCTATDSKEVFIDPNKPTYSFKIDASNWTDSRSTILLSTANDDISEISDVRYSISKANLSKEKWLDYSEAHTYMLPKTSGEYTIYGQVRTSKGQVSRIVSESITLDIDPPTGDFNIKKDITGEVNITLILDAEDNFGTVSSVKVSLKNETGDERTYDYARRIKYQLPDDYGKHKVCVQFITENGQKSGEYFDSVFLDNKGPKLENFTLPNKITDQKNLSYNISWKMKDKSPIKTYKIFINSSDNSTQPENLVTSTPYVKYEFKDKLNYNISVKAIDRFGNSRNYTRNVTIKINYPPKEGKITFPEKMVEGELTFKASSEDPNGDSLNYRWYVNGKKAGGGKSFTGNFGPGKYKVKLVVSDGEHEKTITRKITVESEGLKLSEMMDYIIPASVVIGVILTVVIVYLYMRRKEKRRKDMIRDAKSDDSKSSDRKNVRKVYCELNDTSEEHAWQYLKKSDLNMDKDKFKVCTTVLISSGVLDQYGAEDEGDRRVVYVGEDVDTSILKEDEVDIGVEDDVRKDEDSVEKDEDLSSKDDDEHFTECPNCGESNESIATECHNCGKSFLEDDEEDENSEQYESEGEIKDRSEDQNDSQNSRERSSVNGMGVMKSRPDNSHQTGDNQ